MFTLVSGVDDSESECGLDGGVTFDWIINNDTDGPSLEEQLQPLLKLALEAANVSDQYLTVIDPEGSSFWGRDLFLLLQQRQMSEIKFLLLTKICFSFEDLHQFYKTVFK